MDFRYQEMGKRIQVRRKELKLKQDELAERLGISNNHMSSIENGKQRPSMDVFLNICDNLNTTPDYLLLGTIRPQNVSQNIIDKLRLRNQYELGLINDFIDILAKNNPHFPRE